MGKTVTFFLVLIGVSYVNAKECEGFYVTNNPDTIKCKINIEEIFSHKNFYHFHRISEGVNLKDAEKAKGNVHVFLNKNGINPSSIWETVEKPILEGKNKIIYHKIKP